MNKELLHNKLYELATSRKAILNLAIGLGIYFGYEVTPELQAQLLIFIGGVWSLAVGVQSGLDAFGNGDINLRDKLVQVAISRKAWFVLLSVAGVLGADVTPEFAASGLAVIAAIFTAGTAVETGLKSRA